MIKKISREAKEMTLSLENCHYLDTCERHFIDKYQLNDKSCLKSAAFSILLINDFNHLCLSVL